MALADTRHSHDRARPTADARFMRNLLAVASVLLFAGCGHTPPTAAPERPAPIPDLAAPVLAPMAARQRLLQDLETEKQQARDRADTFDEAAGRDH